MENSLISPTQSSSAFPGKNCKHQHFCQLGSCFWKDINNLHGSKILNPTEVEESHKNNLKTFTQDATVVTKKIDKNRGVFFSVFLHPTKCYYSLIQQLLLFPNKPARAQLAYPQICQSDILQNSCKHFKNHCRSL